MKLFKIYCQVITSKGVVRRALQVSIIVGAILNLINQGWAITHADFNHINYIKMALTFLVPYMVSTYSSAKTRLTFKVNEVSSMDAVLQCKSCNKTKIFVNKGEVVPPCRTCGHEKTRWHIVETGHNQYRQIENEHESMALFAQMNPAPVLRFDVNGKITQANTAAQNAFEETKLEGENISSYVPTINNIDLENLIHNGDIRNLTAENQHGLTFRFELRGLPQYGAVQMYGADITEIVVAKQEANKFLTGLEQTSNSIMITNKNGDIEYVNKAFEAISGYKKKEVLGKNPRFLKTGHTSPEEYKKLWQTISNGKVWRGEMLNKRKDGKTYWEESTISPVLDEHGQVDTFIAIKEDVTEKRQIKQELRSMALFAELNPEPVFRFNKHGKIIKANPAANEAFQKNSVENVHIADLMPELQKYDCAKMIDEELIETIEIKVHDRIFRLIMRGLTEHGVVQTYGSDITKKRQIQQEVESMALFAELNPEPVFRFNAEGEILKSNPAANLAFEEDDITGRKIEELLPEMQQFDCEKFIAEEKIEIMEATVHDRIYRFILRGLPDVGVVQTYGSDITKRKHAEEKIRKQKQSIDSSIQYASRIQGAVLPSIARLSARFRDSFVLYKPRDVVSGDFYWMKEDSTRTIVVASDCTGHGVPGAFMSMLGVALLNEIVNRNPATPAGEILDQLRNNLKATLSQNDKKNEAKDGMDMSLCIINHETNAMQYAGAYNSIYLIREGNLTEYKADKMPIGAHIKEKPHFTSHDIQLEENDAVYLLSDGYPDQFGGSSGMKLSKKKFKSLITEESHLPMGKQKEKLNEFFEAWKGDQDQVDDVLVMGFKV